MIGSAVKELAKLAPDALAALQSLDLTSIQALADWLDGDDSKPEPSGVLSKLGPLKMTLALERAEARAAKAGGG